MSLPRLHGLAMPTGPGAPAAPPRQPKLRVVEGISEEDQGPAYRCRCGRRHLNGWPAGKFFLKCGKCKRQLVLDDGGLP